MSIHILFVIYCYFYFSVKTVLIEGILRVPEDANIPYSVPVVSGIEVLYYYLFLSYGSFSVIIVSYYICRLL